MRASRDMMRVFLPLMIVIALAMAVVPLCAMPYCSPTMGSGMQHDMGLGGTSFTQAPCDMQLLSGSVPSVTGNGVPNLLAIAALAAFVVAAPRIRKVEQLVRTEAHDPPDDPLFGRLII